METALLPYILIPIPFLLLAEYLMQREHSLMVVFMLKIWHQYKKLPH